jgi:hypothetical protein
VISYELLMLVIRSSVRPDEDRPGTVPGPPADLNGHGEAAAELFAGDLATGKVPGVRRIRKGLKVGQPKAQQIREYLAGVVTASGHGGR